MIAKLLLLFTIVPIIELSILIPLGQWMGVVPTVALVLTTGIAGAVLAKRQGVAAWRRLKGDLGDGRLPQDSLLDGLAILVAGAFLVTPGVLTDVTGLLLLVPVVRRPLKHYLKKRLQGSLESESSGFLNVAGPSASGPFDRRPPRNDGEVIDVTPAQSANNSAVSNSSASNPADSNQADNDPTDTSTIDADGRRVN